MLVVGVGVTLTLTLTLALTLTLTLTPTLLLLLLPPQEWAAAKFLSTASAKTALAEGMLYHHSGGGMQTPL